MNNFKNKNNITKKLKKEINILELKLNYLKILNLKNSIIKNFKISTKTLQLITPYILTAQIVASSFKLLGLGLPFYKDTFKKNIKPNTSPNSYHSQIYQSPNNNNIIYYHSNWIEESKNIYSKTINIYKLNNIKEKELLNILNKDNINLNDLFGNPISTQKEITTNITNKELNKESYLQIYIYDENTNNYIILKETNIQNFIITILYILSTTLAELIPLTIRCKLSNFNYNYSIEDIKRKHQPINHKKLEKKLEIKKENYQTLTR